jgi:AraC-like DNA-binding protein
LQFLNHLKVEQRNIKSMKAQSLATTKVNEIIQRVISETYKTSPTVQEMASMADMSVSKFKIIFSNEYGESPHQHILGEKLIMARELLRSGRYSVSQVSYKVGFNHPSGFTRLFKHKFQCNPSELIFSNHL